MKVILSRKGFDGANGGVASPLFEGKLYTFPIPETHKVPDGHRIEYSEILTKIGDYPLAKSVEDLTRGKKAGSTRVHLDPDIERGSYPRAFGWRGLFGQSGAAQGSLKKAGVGTGDLFLFYGWFREAVIQNGKFCFVRSAPDRHIFFGYLEVAEVLPLGAHPPVPVGKEWAAYHPHFGHEKKNSTIYAATEKLSFAPQLPGCGVFREFGEELVLSDPNDPGHRRGQWLLPECFAPRNGARALTYHQKQSRWGSRNGCVTLDSVDRGQEFVCDTKVFPGVGEWARKLIADNAAQRSYWAATNDA